MARLLRPFINGKYLDAPSLTKSSSPLATSHNGSQKFQLINPATAVPHNYYHPSSTAELEHAVECGSASIGDDVSNGARKWHDAAPCDRAAILRDAARLLEEQAAEATLAESLETGRPVRETRVDVGEAGECLQFYAGIASTTSEGQVFSVPGQQQGNNWAYTLHQPLGLTLGIGSWNFPLLTAAWKSAAALAFGNSMIFKPSEFAPSTALLLARCYREAGVPEGVFQVVLGGEPVGRHLASHARVQKVSFTGSHRAGKQVYEQAARGMKRVTLELGGKNPLIVMPGAHLDDAVSAAMLANWYASGQVCSNATRVFVHHSLLDDFLARIVPRTAQLRIGDPMDESTHIGPMAHYQHYRKVLDYIQIGKSEGATLLYGGTPLNPHREQLHSSASHDPPHNLPQHCQNGYFIHPAIFVDCHDDMRIVNEEIFGMVMTILPFQTESEVIHRANNCHFHTDLSHHNTHKHSQINYGLAAGVFTNDLQQAHRMIRQLEAGVTWINTYNVAPVQVSWGGWKQSGLGRELGTSGGRQEWTREKSVVVEMGNVGDWFTT